MLISEINYSYSTEDKSSKLAKAFEKLMCCESDSMLKKYLTKEVYEKLKCETTSNGGTLLDCINSGKRYL